MMDRIARMMAMDANKTADGKADLVNGKVPAEQLPSYVLEYNSTSAFPATGESGKIYVATDTNKTYRWGDSAYVEISESLALGETASTAYPGNKGKANADAIAKKPGEITTGKQYTISGQTVTAGTGAEAFNDLTNNKAAGRYSHAEGNNTAASGDSSHAEGYGTKASGVSSHAEGNSTTASGNYSHAEGNSTIAFGYYSHAEGRYTKAYSNSQHVQGKYNVADANNTYAFIIGNGTADNDRHNAFAIDWNGLIYVNGAATGVDVSALYTKSEVDTALSGKANTSDLGAAAAKGFDAAPTSGNTNNAVSSDGVYQALAAKLNTADVDAALSSTSTNPVQNKAVQAPVARLVNAGAKNLADISNPSTVRDTDYTPLTDGGIRLSCSNKSWTQYIVTADVTAGKNYVFSLKVANVTGDLSLGHVFVRDEGSTNYSDKNVTKAGEYILTFTPATSIVRILLFVNNSSTAKTVSLDAYGMLCTAEDYAISPEFVPYAPSNRELYEMILALQSGT